MEVAAVAVAEAVTEAEAVAVALVVTKQRMKRVHLKESDVQSKSAIH